MSKKIKTVDLFCGAGGFTEGFRKAGGFDPVLAIDFDKQAIDTFSYNHPRVRAVCKDISSIDEDELRELTGGSEIDVVIGGPPCQGFSLAGRRIPEDPKNRLFRDFVRVVNTCKPKIFVFENVAGLVSMQSGLVLEAICDEFERIGYSVNYAILNSATFGAPQARPRFIMIGASSCKALPMPIPTHGPAKECNLDLFGNTLLPFLTVHDALSNLPVLEQGQGDEIMQNVPPENSYQQSTFGDRNPGTLYNHRSTCHSQKIIDRYSAMPQGGNVRSLPIELRTKKNSVFRLAATSPAPTITCNFRTDVIHPWLPGGITTREAARLQGFDDDYRFFGNLTRKAKYVTQDDQVGNAVPPILSKALGLHVKKSLGY